MSPESSPTERAREAIRSEVATVPVMQDYYDGVPVMVVCLREATR